MLLPGFHRDAACTHSQCTHSNAQLTAEAVRRLRPYDGYSPADAVGPVLAAAPAVLGIAVGAVVVLWHDLSERAMLGDGGANLLGFAAGLGLYLLLPGWAVVLAALAAVGLNVLGETITLSRAIGAVPPLRWVDAVGRRGEHAG